MARAAPRRPQAKSSAAGPRVLLVSRKLPFVLSREPDGGGWRAEPPAEAETFNQTTQNLKVVKATRDCVWIGWPGPCDVEPSEQAELQALTLSNHKYLPIFLEPAREQQFYGGFCKTILWPLLHSSTPTTQSMITQHPFEGDADADPWSVAGFGDDNVEANSGAKLYQAYVAVNQTFKNAIRDAHEDGDVVWVHDYHFMLLPQMLRR